MNDFLATMKGASQRFAGAVADTGAKAMLKVCKEYRCKLLL